MVNDNSTIRAFVALPLPAPVKETLQGVEESMQTALPPGEVRWVKRAAMHLTLRFLGETPVARLGAVAAALDEAAAKHRSLALQLAEAGCFPTCRRPRVLWVGLRPASGEMPDALLRLKADIDTALARCGWEPEAKPFYPHLTVGRIKNPAVLAGLQWNVDVAPIRWDAAVVHLIESELLPDGPRYTVCHTAGLSSLTGG